MTSITIPNSVTSIGESAFSGCYALTSATINGSIGINAFQYCTSLFYLTIGNGVTSIEGQAFADCNALKIVNILDLSAWCNIDFIDGSANPLSHGGVKLYLNGNEVTDLVIPDDVVEIKKYTFYDCDALTSITIPNSVTSMGEYAFSFCDSLTSAIINGSIGKYAFRDCNALTEVTIGNGVISMGEDAFYHCDSLKMVNILDLYAWCNINFKDAYANPLRHGGVKLYLNGIEVTDLVIPNDVVEIKKYTFYDCDALTSITIPNSVTSIGESAFYGCDALTSITIPNSVTSIAEDAFRVCNALTEVTIGNGVTSIGKAAFKDCNALKMVNILDLSAWCNIDFIDGSANPFRYGVKLYLNGNEVTDLVIPDDVVEIKKYVFYNCKALTSITIPNSVTSIGEYAFYYCDASYFYCYAMSPPKINEYTFDSNRKATLYVPKGCLLSYWEAYKWGESFNQIIEME